MITIENNRTNPLTGLGILKDLESFNINDIDEAIQELEDKIGKPYFGNGWEEKLKVLYSLKKFAEKKRLATEIFRLKEQLVERLTAIHGKHKAWVEVANIVNDLQAEGKGREFVRDGLMIELERLENGLTVFDLINADDIHALSSEIGIDPDTLYRGVAEIIATRKSEVIE
ncbi:hypothetical protein [Pseudolactococcus chungangensis]|uniref:hypothetical protein n=1 Tax=Pseudolactococcus chungangensis TaxID=451457 RepID=UPI003FA1F49A